MKTQRALLLSTAVFALGVAAVVRAAGQVDEVSEQVTPPQLQVDSDPGAILFYEFLHSGWGQQDAAVLSLRAADILNGNEVEPFEPQEPTPDDAVLLSPDSDPLAILYWAFRHSGHSAEVAANYAWRGQRRMLDIEPEDPDLDSTLTACQVYPVNLVFCENGDRKSMRSFIAAPCWENKLADCGLLSVPLCPVGEAAWRTVDFDGCDSLPCSWMTVDSLIQVPCSYSSLDCDRISALDCGNLGSHDCCNLISACSEIENPCPECG